MHDSFVMHRFGCILEALCRGSGAYTKALLRQVTAVNKLRDLSIIVLQGEGGIVSGCSAPVKFVNGWYTLLLASCVGSVESARKCHQFARPFFSAGLWWYAWWSDVCEWRSLSSDLFLRCSSVLTGWQTSKTSLECRGWVKPFVRYFRCLVMRPTNYPPWRTILPACSLHPRACSAFTNNAFQNHQRSKSL